MQLFKYCTAIRWQPDRLNSESQEPVTVVEEHWLNELVNKHATTLGRKAGASAARLMADRVLEVFGKGGRADWSHVFRPAVEDEGQSHVGRGPENIVVEGLRDVLSGWTETDSIVARPFIGELLGNNNEMLRRVGIHILNERWESLRSLYSPLVRPGLFVADHLHELYRLLNLRFESFSDEEKSATIAAIRGIPVPEGDEEGPARVERLQFRWLTALAGTAYSPAASWLAELTTKYGASPEHPDYISRIETRWGPGPSQYGAEELVALAEERTLVQTLAAFKPSNSWEGPTVEALTDQLERAVRLAPVVFIRTLPDMLAALITYQHAVIAGFAKLWREPNAERPFEGWNDIWPKLFDFFEALLANPTFWNEDGSAHKSREVTPMWIAASIADILHAGTRDDDRA